MERCVNVSDIHGWGEDPDLMGLKSDWPVEIQMVKVYELEEEYVYSLANAERYAALYRIHGPWALPPIVCIADSEWQIAGAHRMRAAFLAGLTHIPAFIVQVPRA